MDPYSPPLIERGLRGMIGKGLRSKEVRKAMREHGCVYFRAVEGPAALLAQYVKEAEVIAYEELDAQVVRRLVVEDFPMVVTRHPALISRSPAGCEMTLSACGRPLEAYLLSTCTQ